MSKTKIAASIKKCEDKVEELQKEIAALKKESLKGTKSEVDALERLKKAVETDRSIIDDLEKSSCDLRGSCDGITCHTSACLLLRINERIEDIT